MAENENEQVSANIELQVSVTESAEDTEDSDQTVLLPTTTMASSVKISISKFKGLSGDNSEQFLNDFKSYITLHKLEEDERIVAAFQLHLEGPALTWFNNVKDTERNTWDKLEPLFKKQYIDIDCITNPILLAETELFHQIKLAPQQPLEEYHALILDKGRRLKRSERDMLIKFVEGLPHQLAFFVRAGNPANLQQALLSAKTGEAYGYRVQALPAMAVTVPTVTTAREADQQTSDAALASQLKLLTDQVAALTVQVDKKGQREYRGPRRPQIGQQNQRQDDRTCFACGGKAHIKRNCNFVQDNGLSACPATQCQVCEQWGHSALSCRRLAGGTQGN